MLRRDRRRERKRSAQTVSQKRQIATAATWLLMLVALVALVMRAVGESSWITLSIFLLAVIGSGVSLVLAQMMWTKEHAILGNPLQVNRPPRVSKPAQGLHHRAESASRKTEQRRGASRL